jgi:small subunit ribosomal protein S4
MNYTGPKVRLSRRLGIALTPKAARVMEKRSGPPGQHGPAKAFRSVRLSDYKRQLTEKQRLRAQYNVHERQMRNYFRRALKSSGNTGEALIQLLESRLDALVLRAGFARTIYAARQFVTHGHITVNGRRVSLPGYRLSPGDALAVKAASQAIPAFAQAREASTSAPAYLEIERGQLSARFLRLPTRDEAPVICEVQAVVEFYSR